MLFITNISSIENIPEDTDSKDKISIFCKETDSLKIPEINRLLKQSAEIEFVPVNGKDDMLICLGAIVSSTDKCTFLDPSITVPKRYEDKIHVVKKTARKTGTRTRRKKSEPAQLAQPQTADDGKEAP